MKTYLLKVYIEVSASALNRPFEYLYNGDAVILKGMRVLISFKNKNIVGYVFDVFMIDDLEKFRTTRVYAIKPIVSIIDNEPIISEKYFRLIERVSDYYYSPLINVLQCALPPSLRPTSGALKGPKTAHVKYIEATRKMTFSDLTKKQTEILTKLQESGPMEKSLLSSTIIKNLLAKGYVCEVLREKDRLEFDSQSLNVAKKDLLLTDEQNRVIESFVSGEKSTYLLQGVTGSGKTEVYLSLAQKFLDKGKSVLLIVSEINLTPLMIALCRHRFGDRVALLHSQLTPAQKYDQYRKIANGLTPVVVGARSAIFAPMDNLGLIVIDEEHTNSYHQDTPPFYSCHQVAQLRQELNSEIKILLGSATPSIITKARATKGLYGFLELPRRINEKELPKVEVVNMQEPLNFHKNSMIISNTLYEGINNVLAQKEQAVLLLNRRGFASSLECERCHAVIKCEECGSSLTYHKEDRILKCHRCEKRVPYPQFCPECGYKSFYHVGFGTEAVTEEIKKLFPNARVSRIDGDIKEGKKGIISLLNAFNDQRIDILVGTQMIAKGHDFENVTLSAVITADIGLKLPNYMASENAFDLIYQTIGRAGRGKKEGRAIIQTFNPQHYAIQYASSQNYESFFKQEMIVRKLSKFPPYWYLTLLHIYTKDSVDIVEFSQELFELISQSFSDYEDKIGLVGPYDPFIKRYGPYRKKLILIRTKDRGLLKGPLLKIIDITKNNGNVKIDIEVDPGDIY